MIYVVVVVYFTVRGSIYVNEGDEYVEASMKKGDVGKFLFLFVLLP